MIRRKFAALQALLEQDPEAYRLEVARLRAEQPQLLEAFVEQLWKDLACTNADEPRPVRRMASIRALMLGEYRPTSGEYRLALQTPAKTSGAYALYFAPPKVPKIGPTD